MRTQEPQGTEVAPPNVLWVFGDQHRAQALSCAGDPNVQTPNIDRLAGEGVVLTGAVAGCPLCSPFRGSLLTGRYPHRCVPGHDEPLPDGQATIAAAFRQAGYHTAYFGKWHVDGACHRPPGTREAFQTVDRRRRGGFDTWIGYENNNIQWDCWVHGHDETGQEVERYRLPGYETDALTGLLLDYLARRGSERAEQESRPFFAALSVQPPHCPYIAPAEYMARHNPARLVLRPNVPPVRRVEEQARRDLAGYYAMIENLDWNVGRIRQALEAAGLAENTFIVFFSDHGDMLGSHGQILKCMPWEESLRVPFILGGGAGARRGATHGRRSAVINHVDIAPTTLGLCGLAKPEWMAGFDYSGCLLPWRQAPEPDSAYLQLVDPGRNVDRERPWRGIVTADGWKYAVLEGQPWLMFDLNEDPYELANLAMDGRFAAQRQRLQDRLAGWIADTGDVFRLPDI